MTSPRPQFELRRIDIDGFEGEPELRPVLQIPLDTQTDRRGFLGAGVAISTALGMLGLTGPSRAQSAVGKTTDTTSESADCKGNIYAHGNPVTQLEFSNDARLLVSVAKEELKLWDCQNGKLLASVKDLKSRSGRIKVLAISEDGRHMAVLTGNRTVLIKSLPDGKTRHALPRQTVHMRSAVFSPDGKHLVTSDETSTPLRMWSVASGKEVQSDLSKIPKSVLPSGAKALAFSDDGEKLFAVRKYSKKRIAVISFPDGQTRQILGPNYEIDRLFIPDSEGFILAISGYFSRASYRPGTAVLPYQNERPSAALPGLPVKYGSEYLTVSNNSFVFRRLDPQLAIMSVMERADGLGKDLKPLLFFSHNGRSITAAANNGAVISWSAKTGKIIKSFNVMPDKDDVEYLRGATTHLEVSPGGETLAVAWKGNSSIQLWSVSQAKRLVDLKQAWFGLYPGHGHVVEQLLFTADGTRLVSRSRDKIMIWSVPDGQAVAVLELDADDPKSGSRSLTLDPEGKLLACFDHTGLKFWTLPDGSPAGELSPGVQVYAAVFSKDGHAIIFQDELNTLRFWDLKKKKSIAETKLKYPVRRMTITTSGQYVLYDERYLLSLPGLRNRRTISPSQEIRRMHLHPKKDQALMGSGSLFDLAENTLLATFFITSKNDKPQERVSAQTFDASGTRCAILSTTGRLIVRPVPELTMTDSLSGPWKVKTVFQSHLGNKRLAISTDGNLLAMSDRHRLSIIRRDQSEPPSCLFDKEALGAKEAAQTVEKTSSSGVSRTWTQPCGSPVPANAVCTCNCVSGTGSPARLSPYSGGTYGGGGGRYCSCNKVCTCVPVYR